MQKSNDNKKQPIASDNGFWFSKITTALQRTSGRSLNLMASNASRINLHTGSPGFPYPNRSTTVLRLLV